MDASDELRAALKDSEQREEAAARAQEQLAREREKYEQKEREVKERLYEAASLTVQRLNESRTAKSIPIEPKRPGLGGLIRQQQHVDGWEIVLYVESYVMSSDGMLIRPSTSPYGSPPRRVPLNGWVDQKIGEARGYAYSEDGPGLFQRSFEGSGDRAARESLYSHLSQANDLVIRSLASVLHQRELSI